MTDLDHVENAAVKACRDGGAYLREAFRADDRDGEYTAHDVKARADRESERRMLDTVLDAFPDHHVYAEESGDHPGDSSYRWIIDPLDGTNNFTAGISSFATAATVLEDDDPILAVTYVPMLDDLYVARRDEGVRYDGEPVVAETGHSVEQSTVGFVIGHDVKRDENRLATSKAIRTELESQCKRVVESWSPCVHWGLLSRGLLDGMVTFYPDPEEQRAGELFATEADVAIESWDECFVGTAAESSCPVLLDAVESAL
ncbi:inositol monophosphatase family protein [Halorussus halophilus]|uniref:inositol monophosphatase family protein n=1 Tax=Halorussus halophilus TaxID=2650975 RepID=UPI0013019659|nr:inositol monophosphatase family protein [Halorussus halophilus]